MCASHLNAADVLIEEQVFNEKSTYRNNHTSKSVTQFLTKKYE